MVAGPRGGGKKGPPKGEEEMKMHFTALLSLAHCDVLARFCLLKSLCVTRIQQAERAKESERILQDRESHTHTHKKGSAGREGAL